MPALNRDFARTHVFVLFWFFSVVPRKKTKKGDESATI
jgi:hypothetical protein